MLVNTENKYYLILIGARAGEVLQFTPASGERVLLIFAGPIIALVANAKCTCLPRASPIAGFISQMEVPDGESSVDADN